MEFDAEMIKALGQINRDMDAGIIPFVMLNSNRIAMRPEAMAEFMLEQGQTIDNAIFTAILRSNIAHCQAKIAEQDDTVLQTEFLAV